MLSCRSKLCLDVFQIAIKEILHSIYDLCEVRTDGLGAEDTFACATRAEYPPLRLMRTNRVTNSSIHLGSLFNKAAYTSRRRQRIPVLGSRSSRRFMHKWQKEQRRVVLQADLILSLLTAAAAIASGVRQTPSNAGIGVEMPTITCEHESTSSPPSAPLAVPLHARQHNISTNNSLDALARPAQRLRAAGGHHRYSARDRTCLPLVVRPHLKRPVQHPRERRVSQTPATVARLVRRGFVVKVEQGAGIASRFSDGQSRP